MAVVQYAGGKRRMYRLTANDDKLSDLDANAVGFTVYKLSYFRGNSDADGDLEVTIGDTADTELWQAKMEASAATATYDETWRETSFEGGIFCPDVKLELKTGGGGLLVYAEPVYGTPATT